MNGGKVAVLGEVLKSGTGLAGEILQSSRLSGVTLTKRDSLAHYVAACELVAAMDHEEQLRLVRDCLGCNVVLFRMATAPEEYYESLSTLANHCLWYALCSHNSIDPHPTGDA